MSRPVELETLTLLTSSSEGGSYWPTPTLRLTSAIPAQSVIRAQIGDPRLSVLAETSRVSANSHAEFSIERFETVARTAKNLLHEALLAVAKVIAERRDTAEQQPEGVDTLFHDSDRLLVTRAAEGRVSIANGLVRHRCPRTNATHAAISLQRAHGAGIELVVDQVSAAAMQVNAFAQAIGGDQHIGPERTVEDRVASNRSRCPRRVPGAPLRRRG